MRFPWKVESADFDPAGKQKMLRRVPVQLTGHILAFDFVEILDMPTHKGEYSYVPFKAASTNATRAP
jgi:hypothetical protein